MSAEQLPYVLLLVIPLGFALLWFGITSALGVASGWTHLQTRYPDRPEEAIESLRRQSGGLGRGLTVSYNNCLRLDLCPGGLRVGLPKLLGPMLKPFFVPWSDVTAEERMFLRIRSFRLRFGDSDGELTVRAKTWERIAALGFVRL